MLNIKQLSKKAKIALEEGRFLAAINIYDKLLFQEQGNFEYLMLRGSAYMQLENFELALADYAKVVQTNNSHVGALSNFGVALIRCNKIQEASEILEYALELDPNNFDVLVNIGTVYQALGKPELALKVAFKAIELRPNAYIAYNNLGAALGDLNLNSEALEAYKTSNKLNSTYVPTIINLAQLEIKNNNNLEGLRLYEEALKLRNLTPSESELIKYYTSYSYLYEGKLDLGWERYDHGFGTLLPLGALRSLRRFHQQKWSGESIEGKTLLIWREQGLGDEIEFSSCLLDIHNANYVDKVIVECDKRLINIFCRIFPKFEFRSESFDSDGYPLQNDFDFHCPVGTLPKIFRKSIQDFSLHQMRFDVLPTLKEKFRTRLGPFQDKKLIGICWRSGLLKIERNANYTAIDDWETLLTQKDLQFVNLQYGECELEIQSVEQRLGIKILRWDDVDLKNDLESVIALCSELDSVVTVGTAVVALAGYTGVNTFMLSHKSWIMLGEEKILPWCKNVNIISPDSDKPVADAIVKVKELLV